MDRIKGSTPKLPDETLFKYPNHDEILIALSTLDQVAGADIPAFTLAGILSNAKADIWHSWLGLDFVGLEMGFSVRYGA